MRGVSLHLPGCEGRGSPPAVGLMAGMRPAYSASELTWWLGFAMPSQPQAVVRVRKWSRSVTERFILARREGLQQDALAIAGPSHTPVSTEITTEISQK